MKVLTDEQRAKLLKVLEGAPDDVLCSAVLEMKRVRIDIQENYKSVSAFVGRDEVKLEEKPAPMMPPASLSMSVINEVLRPDIPPGTACSRVGAETKAAIKARCMRPSTAEEVNTFLKRGKSKLDETISILKLMWDRGELVYENKTYRNKT